MPHAAGEGSGHPQHGRYAPRHYTPRQIRRYVRRARPAPKVFHHGHYRPPGHSVGRAIQRGARQGRHQAAKDQALTPSAIRRRDLALRFDLSFNPLARKLRKFDFYGRPGQVDQADFEDYYTHLWAKAHGLYGAKGKAPKLKVGVNYPGVLGEVFMNRPRGKRSVDIARQATQMAQLRPSQRKGLKHFKDSRDVAMLARSVPLHEWAHVFQHRGPRPLVEGGAEAFAQLAAQQLGQPYHRRARDPYKRFAASVLRRRGRGYVQRGQFR